jgi:hypothetical protein
VQLVDHVVVAAYEGLIDPCPLPAQFQQAVDGLWAATLQRPRTRLNLALSVRSRLAST